MVLILFCVFGLFLLPVCAECVRQAVLQASAALRSELDEEKTKYQGLLKDFTRLEQRYDNLRDMSLLSEVRALQRRALKRSLFRFTLLFSCSRCSVAEAIGGPTPPRV